MKFFVPHLSPLLRGEEAFLFSFSSIGEGWDEVDIVKKINKSLSF